MLTVVTRVIGNMVNWPSPPPPAKRFGDFLWFTAQAPGSLPLHAIHIYRSYRAKKRAKHG